MLANKMSVLLFTTALLVLACEALPSGDRRQVLVVPLTLTLDRGAREPVERLLREPRAVPVPDYDDESSDSASGDMAAAATLVFRPLFVYRQRGSR